MIRIDVRGLDGISEMLKRGGKQARFAAAVALTRTAKVVEQGLKHRQAAMLPISSPWTARSQYVKPATKASLEAKVGIKDRAPARGTAPAKLLREHFTGARRGPKPMEVALRARGILPNGWHVVPGAALPLDGYGNPKRTAIAEILGGLKSGLRVYAGKGKRARAVGYFVAPIQLHPRTAHLAPGIYQRIERSGQSVVRPMLIFVRLGQYRRVIDLPGIARAAVAKDFPRLFAAAWQQAMSTAR